MTLGLQGGSLSYQSGQGETYALEYEALRAEQPNFEEERGGFCLNPLLP